MSVRVSDVDLRLLRVFDTIVHCGGFSAAQAELNVGQSTISTQMTDLETRLGVRLCQRGRVGFALTEEGERVHAASQRLFAALEDFRAEVGQVAGKLVGDLVVGIVDNTVTNPDCRLPDAIHRFNQRDNDVHVTVRVLPPGDLERGVLDGRIALGVGAFPREVPGLAYTPLFSEEQTLYCGLRHPLFRRADSASLAEVEGCAYASRGYLRPEHRPGLTLNRRAAAFDMEGLAMLVLSGRYIADLPTHYAAAWVERGLMRPLVPKASAYVSTFHLITRRGTQPSPVVAAFTEDLLAEQADTPMRR